MVLEDPDLGTGLSNRVVFGNTPTIEASEHTNFGTRRNWFFDNGMELVSETNIYTHDFVRREDIDLTATTSNVLFQTARSDVFEQDLNLRFASGRFDGVVGFFFTNIKSSQPFTVSLGPVSFGSDPEFKTTNYAVFGEVDIDASDLLAGLSFTIGARYDIEEFCFADFSSLNGIDTSSAENSGDTTFEAFTPKLSATYAFNESQSISLTYQRGYRGGGASTNPGALLPPDPTLPPGTPPPPFINEFDAEFSDTIEVAYRGSYIQDQMRMRANLYYTGFSDQQVRFEGPFNTNDDRTVNAGKSEAYGGEITVEGEATADLSLFVGLAYTITNFIRFRGDPGTPAGAAFDFSGNAFAGSSEFSASLGGRYGLSDVWSFGVYMSFTEGPFLNNANDLSEDDRFLVNAELLYENAKWSITSGIYVRNLFGKNYALDRLRAPTATNPGQTSARTGEPRTVGFLVEKSF